ncbi:hypothetical protein GALMADRAFT_244536 [Galerina marginata CBS 339.88]|uniref:Transmembrane protein n=1 Tax=Galerina marginata (strain CBS 339.88) TaxID=685588 RepID=A0A067T960_GALM3|nr:hypothetical protein GALMADRAFT_244536 [Galerina marginata CBS 339.88]
MPFTLQYNVTRNFRWRWFGPISVLGAFISLIFLVLLNIPLTGYETVVTFQDDFNATDSHWFYRWMPYRRPTPGTLCESHLFRVGDSFTTNYSFFEWNIDTIIKPNAGGSAISYSGTPLTFCDVSSVYLNGDLHTWTVDFTVVVACEQDNLFKITAKTFFSMGLLPGRYSPLLGLTRLFNDGTTDMRGAILDGVIRAASQDLGDRTYHALVASNYTTIMILSLEADFAFCPLSLGLAADCGIKPPKFAVSSAAVAYANATVLSYDSSDNVSDSNPYVLDADTEIPVHNILEAVYAAVRIDLGIPSLNNFILNPAFTNSTIYATFPATQWNSDAASRTSTLYYNWTNPEPGLRRFLPVNISGPAQIQVVYPCRFQQPKYIGPLLISVIVATLSMFSGGWALYILIATALAKRQDSSANRCYDHCSGQQTVADPSWFDTSADLQLDHLKRHEYQPIVS